MDLMYGFIESPYGNCMIAFDQTGICAMHFACDLETGLTVLKKSFPQSLFTLNFAQAEEYKQLIFDQNIVPKLNPHGTEFQQQVWNALLQIPKGKTVTYKEIAITINRPKATRAVGSAIGANPIAYIIPCHRVIRSDGKLGGYRWGLELKLRLLASESNPSTETTLS